MNKQAKQAKKWQRRANSALDRGVSAFEKGQKEYAKYCFSKSHQFEKIATRYGSTKYLSNDGNDGLVHVS